MSPRESRSIRALCTGPLREKVLREREEQECWMIEKKGRREGESEGEIGRRREKERQSMRKRRRRAQATLQEQRLKISINGRIVLKDNLTRG